MRIVKEVVVEEIMSALKNINVVKQLVFMAVW